MKKLTKTIAALEGLKSESSIGNVREIVSLMAKIVGTEYALDKHDIMLELDAIAKKASDKAQKLLSKNPDMTFEELVRKVCKR